MSGDRATLPFPWPEPASDEAILEGLAKEYDEAVYDGCGRDDESFQYERIANVLRAAARCLKAKGQRSDR